MNTDGIRGFWLHALASLRIVHWSQEGKFSAQYRVSNNKMELSLRYWGLYDHIYGMSVCMIASMDHLDMLRVTNGAFSPLSGFVWSHLWDDCLYDRIYRPSGRVTCYQWSILSAIGMTVCMIASMDHLDMFRVTNGASYPLSGWPLMGQKLGKIRHSPCSTGTGEAGSQSAQCASQLGQSGVQSCRCFSILWCHRRDMLVFGPKRACVWM